MVTELISGFLGAAIGGLATFVAAQRKLAADYVTGERAKWRLNIRELAKRLASGQTDTSLVWFDLALNTSPFDAEDIALIRDAKTIGSRKVTVTDQQDLADRFALLLKHDWDRAKSEVGWWAVAPHRRSFADYRRNPNRYWSGQRPID
jgi:hypothetical protein